MTIKLLKDCPQYGAKWTLGKVIHDVYLPDAKRMIRDGEAEEYSENVLVQKTREAAKKTKEAPE